MSFLSGLFGGGGGQSGVGNKSNTSSTTNTTTNQYTDESANAGGDNSLAVGSGATVNIQNLSESVANTAINAGVKQTEFTVNTLKGIVESSARENEQTRNSSDLALKAAQSLNEKLQDTAAGAIERSQNPEATSLSKVLLPIVIAAAAVLAIWLYRRK